MVSTYSVVNDESNSLFKLLLHLFCIIEIGGPVIGCLMGTVNMAVLTMVIILFVVMGQETRKQQQSMARSELCTI